VSFSYNAKSIKSEGVLVCCLDTIHDRLRRNSVISKFPPLLTEFPHQFFFFALRLASHHTSPSLPTGKSNFRIIMHHLPPAQWAFVMILKPSYQARLVKNVITRQIGIVVVGIVTAIPRVVTSVFRPGNGIVRREMFETDGALGSMSLRSGRCFRQRRRRRRRLGGSSLGNGLLRPSPPKRSDQSSRWPFHIAFVTISSTGIDVVVILTSHRDG